MSIVEYTAQLRGDYDKPLQGSLLNNQYNGKPASYFFVAHLKLKETRFKHMFLFGESALWAIMVEEISQRSNSCIFFVFQGLLIYIGV